MKPQDLIDEALELEIKAAGLRMQANVMQGVGIGDCYFAERGKADGQRLRMEALIKQRSEAQVARMTRAVEVSL